MVVRSQHRLLSRRLLWPTWLSQMGVDPAVHGVESWADRRCLHAHGLGAAGLGLRDPAAAGAGVGVCGDHGVRIRLHAPPPGDFFRGIDLATIASQQDCFVPKRRAVMTTYVMLANWTDQGALKVKDSPRRLDAAKKALKEMSGEFKHFFLTMGDYDIVAIYEAPDDAVAARFSLQLGMLGNVRTRTLKAFPEAAYREIIHSLG